MVTTNDYIGEIDSHQMIGIVLYYILQVKTIARKKS